MDPAGLMDIQVNVDLHTRKERTAAQAWNGFYSELEQAVVSGFCGIMIHHQRMNRNALLFLDDLLERMAAMDMFRFYNLQEILETTGKD